MPPPVARRYRRIALRLHPDKNAAAAAAQEFSRACEAYNVLSNGGRRRALPMCKCWGAAAVQHLGLHSPARAETPARPAAATTKGIYDLHGEELLKQGVPGGFAGAGAASCRSVCVRAWGSRQDGSQGASRAPARPEAPACMQRHEGWRPRAARAAGQGCRPGLPAQQGAWRCARSQATARPQPGAHAGPQARTCRPTASTRRRGRSRCLRASSARRTPTRRWRVGCWGRLSLCWGRPALLGQARSAGAGPLCWGRPALLGQARSAGAGALCWGRRALLGQARSAGAGALCWGRPALLGQASLAGSLCWRLG